MIAICFLFCFEWSCAQLHTPIHNRITCTIRKLLLLKRLVPLFSIDWLLFLLSFVHSSFRFLFPFDSNRCTPLFAFSFRSFPSTCLYHSFFVCPHFAHLRQCRAQNRGPTTRRHFFKLLSLFLLLLCYTLLPATRSTGKRTNRQTISKLYTARVS